MIFAAWMVVLPPAQWLDKLNKITEAAEAARQVLSGDEEDDSGEGKS